jgi:hypothetical protein
MLRTYQIAAVLALAIYQPADSERAQAACAANPQDISPNRASALARNPRSSGCRRVIESHPEGPAGARCRWEVAVGF